MDEALLAEARKAQERLVEVERDAEAARAEFHRAVRGLHLDGASLRELAAVLGLSHQRVHQIVEAAGGGPRWRRRRGAGTERICTFCGRGGHEVRTLVAGPGVCICGGCVDVTDGVLQGAPAETPLGRIEAVAADQRHERCSFCGKQGHQVRGMASTSAEVRGKHRGRALICDECLGLCREIVAEQAT